MKVITSPEVYHPSDDEISVFLAGGITNCYDWQSEVIAFLQKYNDDLHGRLDKLVIYNPRRPTFPIDDPSAAQEQIEWEFKNLEKMDIFSMMFVDGPSQQPICLYELGRNLVTMQNRFPDDYADRIVISYSTSYTRSADVAIQTQLAMNNLLMVSNDDHPDVHAMRIVNSYLKILQKVKIQNETKN